MAPVYLRLVCSLLNNPVSFDFAELHLFFLLNFLKSHCRLLKPLSNSLGGESANVEPEFSKGALMIC